MSVGPVLSYGGAKWRLAPWILAHLPKHATYIEPYFGSGGVYFQKDPVRNEYLNDLSGEIVNFFQILRDRPEDLI